MRSTIHATILVLAAFAATAIGQSEGGRPLPDEARQAIEKGIAAAKSSDYLLAITCLDEARNLAPHSPLPFYYLGLAESQIPGRELRAICWFHAFLAAAPNAPNADAVTAEIKTLQHRTRDILFKLLDAATDAAELLPAPDPEELLDPDGTYQDHHMRTLSALWARVGETGNAIQCAARIHNAAVRSQAEVDISISLAIAGDMEEGRRILALAHGTAEKCDRPDRRSQALSSVACSLADFGDHTAAQTLAAQIEDAGDRSRVQAAIARAQATAGDLPAAIRTANDIPVNFHRCAAQAFGARTAAEYGDRDAAARLLAAARESFAGVRHDPNAVHEVGMKPIAVKAQALGLNGRAIYPAPDPPRSVAEVNEETFDVSDLHLDCFITQGLIGDIDPRDAHIYLMLGHGRAFRDLARARALAGDMPGADAVIDFYINRTSQTQSRIDYRLVSEMNAAIAAGYMLAADYARARARLSLAKNTVDSLRDVDERALRPIVETANAWIGSNEYLLNDPVFTALAAHLNSVPRRQNSETFSALADTARALADAQRVVFALHRRPILP